MLTIANKVLCIALQKATSSVVGIFPNLPLSFLILRASLSFLCCCQLTETPLREMLHDENVYEHPDRFEPARFLSDGTKPPAPDPARAVFGFGRRICPGRFFADDSLYLTIACVLHTFEISHPTDSVGRKLDFRVEWPSGLVS